MKLIHVVHVQKYNQRHMPDQYHYVGTLDEIGQQLIGYTYKESFGSIQELLSYCIKKHENKDFNLVHSYEM
jgi:hypothetical protein